MAAPAFVQQTSAQAGKVASLAATLAAATTGNNRLVVLVGTWSGASATATAVTDNAGDTFTKLTSFTGADHTELRVWTAVVAAGGTAPTVTATASGSADVGLAVTEYSGLSTVAGAGVVDPVGDGHRYYRRCRTGPFRADQPGDSRWRTGAWLLRGLRLRYPPGRRPVVRDPDQPVAQRQPGPAGRRHPGEHQRHPRAAVGGASVAYTVRNADTARHGYGVALTVTTANRVLGSGASLMPGVEPGATATGR